MFRHTGIESFGMTLLEANYISSSDIPGFTVWKHKRESFAKAGQETHDGLDGFCRVLS
jgi:hypothetical protein